MSDDNLDDMIRDILARDPLDEVEKGLHLVPEPVSAPEGTIDDRDTFAHGSNEERLYGTQSVFVHAMQVNALKRSMMLNSGDSVYSDNLSRYIGITKEVGFKIVLELPFSVKQCFDAVHRNEKLFVMWRPDGVLLVFDTFEGDRVNAGSFYYNWLANERGDRHGATESGGYVLPPGKNWKDVENDNLIWAGHHDCRVGLKFHLRQLEKNGKFLAKWVERPFLWLLHHGDTANKQYGEYDSDKIKEKRIAMLPAEVREAISPVPHVKGIKNG